MNKGKTSYREAVGYLYGLQKYGIKFGLSKTSTLLKTFGNPHESQKYIHFAGTNGKGSAAAFTASILKEAGLKVGLYSSPHLVRFTERFRINDKEITHTETAALIEEIRGAFVSKEPPTFFEATTAMAINYFARENTDIAIMETGMGGRLDATNVITPLVSVITNISMEHQAFLGSRLIDIAGEKAGIIKKNIDVVTGATQPAVIKLFKSIAKEKNAPLWRVGKEIHYRTSGDGFHYYGLKHRFNNLHLGLTGKFQFRNAALSLAVVELLEEKGFNISSVDMREGLSSTTWPGRMQVVCRNPTIILDGAHNPAAVRALTKSIKAGFKYKRLILVIGVMEDKDIGQLLRGIVPVSDYVIYTRPVYSRAANPEVLMARATNLQKSGEAIHVLTKAIDKARQMADPGDLIIICGSLFTVGEAMRYLNPESYGQDDLLQEIKFDKLVLERYLPDVNCKQTILTIRRQAIPHKKTISLKHIFLCVFLLIVFSPQSSFAKDKSSKTGPVAGPDGATVSITLSAEPTSIPGDGTGTSKIAATLLDSAGNPVPVGTSVSFSTDLGSFPGGKNFSVSTDDDTGLVIVSLIAGTIDGICTVTVESNSVTQLITVPFFSEDTHGATAKIKLSAKPKSIPGDESGSSIITATLLDSAGNPVPVGTSVSFSTSLGNFPGGKNFSVSTDDDTGEVTVSLVAGSTPGKATVAANAGSFTEETIVTFEAPETPWEITAKSLAYQEKEEIYTGEGDVVIRKDDQALYAQKVIYNVKTGIVKASGDVRLEAMGDILTGDQGTFNLDKQTGEMVNGRLFLSQNHYYVSGSVMQKLGKNSYLIKQCHLTTCDGDGKAKPWSITGSEVKVTIEGYGKVKHAALRVREFPVLYVPYLIFPAKTKRQTGLLVPEIGYSSRKGFIYTQPFFWAINESSDATLYLEYMSRRGVKGGLEYRYVLKEKSKGTLMYDFLNDRHVDDGTDNSGEDWGYEEDSYNRPNSDRYWFRMKNDQELPFGFDMKADIDIVSDQDYLREFRYGYSGYYQTNRYFEKIFGRGLDGYDDTTRENNLNLNKSWSQFTLYGETRWYDDVISRRQGETYSPLYYLPRITFSGSRQKVFNTPLYFGLDSEYLYTYRRLATKTQRAKVYPTIYLPLNLKNYFSFETSFGVQETIWNIHEYESSSRDGTYNRELFYFKQDLQTDIYNVFDIKGKRLDRIKHVINPQIVYNYSPEENRKDTYPEGRAGETNLLTYSITNIFTSRSIKPSEKNDEIKADEEDKLLNYTYNEFSRFKVQQSYDIKEAREDKDNKEPFSPIYGEIKISPLKYLSVQADATWDYYDNVWNSHNVNLSIWDNRGDRLSVEHRYELDSRESIYYNILIKISDKISTYANYERNMYDNRDIEKGIGVIYSAQCWGINAFYLDDTDEETFGVEFKLYGLGGIGRQFIRGKTEGEY